MNENDVGKFYTTNGDDIWWMVSFCSYPSARLRNLKTGEEVYGAVGSRNLQPFVRLVAEREIKGGDV